ncbi:MULTISPECIES: hypothetical protein [unclassified Imperialibacter]|uniref:hypothetical protein n=1 Tax=unclassified Imperialibacter TaxID=2629706 RepID=UPI0012591C69|nr:MULTISPECIES: hypothetical protein [unclassified Imperialibacter]CAD5250658.1 conserved hypothetical protein [Imperialibacter sp. 75]CAD5286139.1 conserved hypothetical protein [Imperialibacter sp. 89]VVT05314.1 conserved hypothetical protein [Imperialibacter sp. EC-SDR9]
MTASTKSQLVEWITQLDDQELIETISAIKESVEKGDWHKSLNNKQKASIKRGQDDHKEGRVLSSEDFWQKHG